MQTVLRMLAITNKKIVICFISDSFSHLHDIKFMKIVNLHIA